MFRYLILIPMAALVLLALNAHRDAHAISDVIHPENDPLFANFAELNLLDKIKDDSGLSSDYQNAVDDYYADQQNVDYSRYRLLEKRDEYASASVFVFFMFMLTFMPWSKWFNGISKALNSGQALIGKTATRIGRENRSIIRREGIDRYSVSVELKNWKELFDEGVVSEEEYEKARTKLLGRT